MAANPLGAFHPSVRAWFTSTFGKPTPAQTQGWPAIVAGRSALLLAPTGSGKTLAAFLAAIDRLLFTSEPARAERCRVVYVSPLKALAVDVEKNLRVPLEGIAAEAARSGAAFRRPAVAIRSGDTPAAERARIARTPPDILITTPESLFLLLTSGAREMFRSVETVIVDEIHTLVSGKRGTHLFLSLERLEALRSAKRPLQRIGLSATQRPLEEVARLLGGGEPSGRRGAWTPRPVEIVDAGHRRALELSVEVPVEDLGRLSERESPEERSIWPSIYPRLIERIRAHRSTMVFVNNRRLAERIAAALNEQAGEEIALAHHGSVAKDRRREIEDRLKRGQLPAIVATSSLELGIDMGAVDLVIQIEAPPSIAAGVQRIGRAGHQVGGVSKGVILPKHRGDLLAAAAASARMARGLVEETFYPRNPLDVLAQQIVGTVAMDSIRADDLYALVRRAAPFAELPRASFDGVLDMLSGRYPSDEFAELRPRVTWDRGKGTLKAREGARRIAVTNPGTIPDRGLYGVFLPGEGRGPGRRVGELDEEMVFESRVGDIFLLGASSWRIEEITHERVIVAPAPGQPGRMPFWKGDGPGRPLEFGRAIGELARTLAAAPREDAEKRLARDHGLDAMASSNLLAYLSEQKEATGEVPSDRTVVVERYMDEIGDWRVCVLSPFGARVHAPWATAVLAGLKRRSGTDIEMLWSDDGMVFRLPESEDPPDTALFLPGADEVEDLVVQTLGDTALFAAHFRENAGRALLLPRRYPGRRSPLWHLRKRSADLLSVAARFGSFPIVLETYRECLRDVFDLPATVEVLKSLEERRLRVVTVDSRSPSPFAASILFSYVANFLYDLDAPLAERRAQALAVDTAQLKELLGEAELRELLDADAIEETARSLRRLGVRPLAHADALHDLLLALGDLTEEEIAARSSSAADAASWIRSLLAEGRILAVAIAGERRLAAVEDAARLRDALGIVLPENLPVAYLEPPADPLGDLVSRFARTHGPFRLEELAGRFGLGVAPARAALETLAAAGRVVEGELLPGGHGREWCDAEVLKTIKRRSLAKLRRQVEPVEPAAYARLLAEWQGVESPRAGTDALLSAIEQLQACPLPASVLESEILPARLSPYRPADLDALCAAGEVAWRGLERLGSGDGRVALYLADRTAYLAPAAREVESDLAREVLRLLSERGAVFFADLAAATGAFAGDLVAAIWDGVWAGRVTNDMLAPLRSLFGPRERASRRGFSGRSFRARRLGPPGSEGRWSLLAAPARKKAPTETERRVAMAETLLARYGVVAREAVHAEGVAGGFAAVYEVLKRMEETGRVRRGYFVAGLGAAQFAQPGADDRLRALRERRGEERPLVLAATDPANPWGAALAWPPSAGQPQRAAGAQVVLRGGELLAWAGRSERNLLTFLPEAGPEREAAARELARALAELVASGRRRAVLISRVDGRDPKDSPIAQHLAAEGFAAGSRGWLKRGPTGRRPPTPAFDSRTPPRLAR